MRIAIVHSFYSSALPSGENSVVRLQAEALSEAGHEVEVIAASTDELSENRGYKIKTAINVMTGGGLDPSQMLHQFRPDVIHVHNLFPNFSTKWLEAWQGPIVATLHNFRPVCASGILYRDGKTCTLCPDHSQINAVKHGCYRGSRIASIPLAIRNRRGIPADPVLQSSDATVFLSERSRLQYASFGYMPASGHIVPNFVEASEKVDAAQDAGNSWLYIGRIAPEKGTVAMISSWPEHEQIDIYGDGPDSELLRDYTTTRIRYHGLASREKILEELPQAAGLLIPSTCAENFPTVYAEALAAGVPVIAKSGNSAADDVSESNSGVVFDSWSQIPAALNEVAEGRARYSMNATRRYADQFTKRRWVERMIGIYQSLT